MMWIPWGWGPTCISFEFGLHFICISYTPSSTNSLINNVCEYVRLRTKYGENRKTSTTLVCKWKKSNGVERLLFKCNVPKVPLRVAPRPLPSHIHVGYAHLRGCLAWHNKPFGLVFPSLFNFCFLPDNFLLFRSLFEDEPIINSQKFDAKLIYTTNFE